MSEHYPETIALLAQAQATYVQHMKELRKPIPVYNDLEDGLPEEFKGKGFVIPKNFVAPAAEAAMPRKEGVLKGTSKAEQAREIMRATKDSGKPLDEIIQLIMDATGHDKALAKATYKANAGRVGIAL